MEGAINIPVIESGVYFLLNKGEVVYVGSSKKVYSRINSHFYSDKIFDEIKVIPVRRDKILLVEGVMIERYKPKYNISFLGRYIKTGKGVKAGRKHSQHNSPWNG